jgi:CheY-like chemotaxis protein
MAADQDTIPEPGMSILVVDDSRVMRQALKKILSGTYPVVEAADGEEGWARILDDPAVCCVYTDLSMPRLDGFGLIRRIRESGDPRVREIPVVLITGNEDSEGTRERALSAGASGVVKKPFNSADILEVARLHVEAQRARRPAVAPAGARDSAETAWLRERVEELEATLLDVRTQLQGWQEEAQRGEGASMSSSAEWQQTLDAVRQQLRESQEARNRLQKEHDRLRTELILRQQSVDEKRVSDRIRELETQLAAERSDSSRLRSELYELNTELKAARAASGEAADRAADLEARVRHLLSEQGRAREQTDGLRRELESTRGDYEAVEQALGLERGKVVELQARLKALDEEGADWSSRLAETEDELSEWQARARRAEAALEQARAETGSVDADHDDLLRDLEEQRSLAATERERAASAEQELTTERERFQDLESEMAGLREAMEAQRERADAAEQALAELREAHEALEQEATDAETLEALRARAEAAELNLLQIEDELVEMASRLERSEDGRISAENELRALMQELADARRQLRERAAAASRGGSPEPVPVIGKPDSAVTEEVEREEETGTGEVPGEQEMAPGTEEEEPLPQLRAESDEEEPRTAVEAAVDVAGRDRGREPLIRQWEEERRRQRRIQVVVLVSVAAAAALGLYFLLT